ncbi:diguanylate cyclase [Litoribacillus peritrichatus]|uniref:diguanylate cyclase n=1 Tax=Litoribacillus peritrichatus TaxID=718191 RepID=A0ABP7M8W9_9GAMM
MISASEDQVLNVLVIEPSKSYQLYLSEILVDHGFQAVCVVDGEEAIAALKGQSFCLVCVAMQLKDMSGIELCRHIRSREGDACNVPVVMITSEEDKSTLVSALKAGATEIFKKSDINDFSTYLHQFVWNSTQRSTLIAEILYVEDSISIAKMVCTFLKKMGMNVDHFTKAEDACLAFEHKDYDLVLTDIFLEGEMTGSQLIQKFRSNPDNAYIPVLAISGVEDASRRIELLRSGANDYVAKPVLDQELVARVQNLVNTKKLVDKVNEQQRYLQELAMKDQLTGLYNRHFLMEVGPKKVQESRRHKTPLSLIVVDLDKFKSINDEHGHSVGDEVLQAIGKLLMNSVRKEDVAARFGGEEFVLILSHCNEEEAQQKAETIRLNIMNLKPAGLNVTASFGIASNSPLEPETMNGMFTRADEAVYKSKEAGRNCITVSSL